MPPTYRGTGFFQMVSEFRIRARARAFTCSRASARLVSAECGVIIISGLTDHERRSRWKITLPRSVAFDRTRRCERSLVLVIVLRIL